MLAADAKMREESLPQTLWQAMGKGLRSRLRELEEWAGGGRAKPPDLPGLDAFARAAYRQNVEWFGTPADSDKMCEIRQGYQRGFSYCTYNRLLGRYLIMMAASESPPAAQLILLAHEMFHRVTMRQKGVRHDLWITEMLAETSSLRFAKENGLQEHVTKLTTQCLSSRKPVSRLALQSAYRLPITLGQRDSIYPTGFKRDVIRLGLALTKLAGWDKVCLLLRAETLEAWVADLPEAQRYGVALALELPTDEYTPPTEYGPLAVLGNVLFFLGQNCSAAKFLRAAGEASSDRSFRVETTNQYVERLGD